MSIRVASVLSASVGPLDGSLSGSNGFVSQAGNTRVSARASFGKDLSTLNRAVRPAAASAPVVRLGRNSSLAFLEDGAGSNRSEVVAVLCSGAHAWRQNFKAVNARAVAGVFGAGVLGHHDASGGAHGEAASVFNRIRRLTFHSTGRLSAAREFRR